MATTPNLGITHIESNQAQKEVTANEAFDTLDEGLAGEVIHNMTTDANYTLDTSEPAKEHENLVIHITDTGVVLTATRNIILPDSPQLHVAWNDTAQTLNFKAASGVAYAIPAGQIRLFYIESVTFDAKPVSDDAGAGGLAFPGLTDTPGSYTGEGGQVVAVKGAEDGLEFITPGAATGVFWATPYKGALIDLASPITGLNATPGYVVVFDTEVRDTDGFVNLGANPTRITVPAGFSLARVSASMSFSGVDPNVTCRLRINKNGTELVASKTTIEQSYSTPGLQCTTAVIPVSASDYFEASIFVESDTNITLADAWLQLEVLEATTATNPPYDIGMFYSGKPTNGQEVFRMKATRGFTIPNGATGSNAEARVASTASVTFDVKKNGAAAFATINFNVSATGTFTQAGGDEVFAEDDVLTIIAPATADATLEDISLFLKGTRTT